MNSCCYYVEIRETETGKLELRTGPVSERHAERIEDGMNINLNHASYHTVVVTNETGEFSDNVEHASE